MYCGLAGSVVALTVVVSIDDEGGMVGVVSTNVVVVVDCVVDGSSVVVLAGVLGSVAVGAGCETMLSVGTEGAVGKGVASGMVGAEVTAGSVED